jgi:hypothetical protein
MELLPWDSWGLIDIGTRTETANELAFLDRVAALTANDAPDFDTVRALYESDERLRVPPMITTYLNTGAQKIELAKEIGA